MSKSPTSISSLAQFIIWTFIATSTTEYTQPISAINSAKCHGYVKTLTPHLQQKSDLGIHTLLDGQNG